MSERSSVFHSAKVISLSTLLSRVLGLVRDVVSAEAFGVTGPMGAFAFAWQIPNLFRRLFGEGALNSAFVPIFTEYLHAHDRREAVRLFQVVGTALLMLLSALVLAGELIGVSLLSWVPLSENNLLIVILSIILIPYLLLICYAAFLSGAQNSLEHFLEPALMPAVLNVVWIVAIFFATRVVGGSLEHEITVMAGGILVGGAFQVGLQLPRLYREGFRVRFLLDFAHPGLRKIAVQMFPLVLGLSVFQINTLMDNIVGKWFVGDAAPAILYWANRLFQFPLALLAIPIAVAIFPRFSRLAISKDRKGLEEELLRATRMALYLTLPATVGLIIIRIPLVRLIYERGRFTPEDTPVVALVTLGYTLGLAGLSIMHITTRLLYALGDRLSPMKIAFGMTGLNFLLNILLVQVLAVPGLALATSICGTLQAVLLIKVVEKRLGGIEYFPLLWPLLKQAVAVSAMGVATYFCARSFGQGTTAIEKVASVFVPVGAGAVTYFGLSWALRMEEWKEMVRRRSKSKQA